MALPFGLLPEPLRWELLYAIQQRDLSDTARMTPLEFRRAYLHLRRSELTTAVGLEALTMRNQDRNATGMLRDLQYRIDEAHREWSGIDNRPANVYFILDLDLRYSTKSVGRNAKIDLRPIKTSWLLDTMRAFLLEGGPHGYSELSQAGLVVQLVDDVLVARQTRIAALGRADIDAIMRAIRARWTTELSQRRHIAALQAIIRFARTNTDAVPVWKRVPAEFEIDRSRHRPNGTPARGRSVDTLDEPFRFVPQPIIDWLMDHLHLLERRTSYQTAEARFLLYLHERCGRRTGETVRLLNDCLSYDNAGNAYLEWIQGKPPWGQGRRLPIDQETHDAIREWQAFKKQAGVESRWLFPSPRRRDLPIDPGFLLARVHDFIDIIERDAPYDSEVEGAEGNLIYFDLSTIDAYSFRHAYAQRHADATDQFGREAVPQDVLREWMGHSNANTTAVYYAVTKQRRMRAMAALPPRRLNFLGKLVPFDRERESYNRIGVAFGSCTEPRNVAAGGAACAMDYACESCPFFLVDPFEKDGMVAKRQYLMAQIERLQIIAPDSHMVSHYRARVADCDRIIGAIDSYIATLAGEEREKIVSALDKMSDMRRRATAHRRIDLRSLFRGE
ncbi:integrase [Planctomonas deserti]|uniref:integrase n=1 Tax=Planctomonas deserti TaxID=2144185 RepID=UPI00131F2FF1|nr:integrase [Planctomonas deserti]